MNWNPFASTPASFSSPYSQAAAKRLSLEVQEVLTAWFPLALVFWRGKDIIYGKVTVPKVVLYRFVSSRSRRGVRPVFTGSFEVENGTTVLKGNFRIRWYGFIFMFICIASIILAVAVTGLKTYIRIPPEPNIRMALLYICITGLFTAVHAYIAKWHSGEDVEYISKTIRSAIGTQS